MSLFQLPLSYLLWHYTTAWRDLVRIYLNFSWFLSNFFSVRLLSGTLFAPFHRLHESAEKGTAGVLGGFIMNTILRGVGFFARTFIIFCGLFSLVLLFIGMLIFLALWALMPFIIFAALMTGIVGLISYYR